MINFFKRYRVHILLFIIIIVWYLSYSKVPLIFFQQDELMGFGLFFLRGSKMLLSGLGFRDVLHFVPVTMSISYSLFKAFGLNPLPYNLVGLFFHTLNGILIYIIAQKIFKNKSYSILTSILFFSCSAGMELVMWPVINLNTISLSFSLLSIYVLISAYSERGYLKIRESIYVSILFLLSVFSVEYAAGMMFLIPFMSFILDKKGKGFKKLSSLVPFFIATVTYLIFRFAPVFISHSATAFNSVVSAGPINKLTEMIEIPFIYFGQLFLGQGFIINISQMISVVFFNNIANTQFAEGVIYKYVASFIGIGVMFLIVRGFKIAMKIDVTLSKYLIIFSTFIVFSALPFVFVPGKMFSIFPSRYLYFGSVGYSFLITIIFYILIKSKNKRNIFIFGSLITMMVLFGTYDNYKKGNNLYQTGVVRSMILSKIKDSHPVLPKKVIFFTQSDKSYFGLPDNDTILPFQSGLGQTLFLWYYSSEKFSTRFFENEFLWGILSEGYKEEDARGFGYFRDYVKLKESIKTNKLNPDSVIAFRWDANTNTLADMTVEIRKKLSNEIYK